MEDLNSEGGEMNKKQNVELLVTDFLEESKNALFEQLVSDHKRWGVLG